MSAASKFGERRGKGQNSADALTKLAPQFGGGSKAVLDAEDHPLAVEYANGEQGHVYTVAATTGAACSAYPADLDPAEVEALARKVVSFMSHPDSLPWSPAGTLAGATEEVRAAAASQEDRRQPNCGAVVSASPPDGARPVDKASPLDPVAVAAACAALCAAVELSDADVAHCIGHVTQQLRQRTYYYDAGFIDEGSRIDFDHDHFNDASWHECFVLTNNDGEFPLQEVCPHNVSMAYVHACVRTGEGVGERERLLSTHRLGCSRSSPMTSARTHVRRTANKGWRG